MTWLVMGLGVDEGGDSLEGTAWRGGWELDRALSCFSPLELVLRSKVAGR